MSKLNIPKVCEHGACETNMQEYACPYNVGYCVDHCYCPEHWENASNFPLIMQSERKQNG